MKISKNKSQLVISKSDIYPFLYGLDFFLNLSIVSYLCSFLFPGHDLRVSILLTISLVFVSEISKFLILNIKFLALKLSKANNSYLLVGSYLVMILVPKLEFNYFSVLIFLMSRTMVGVCFSSITLNLNFQEGVLNSSKIKYWLIFLTSFFVGSLFLLLINEIFSNVELNNWAWKITYVFLILITFIIILTSSKNISFEKIIDKDLYVNNFNFKYLSQNIHLLIPFFSLTLFSTSTWLPKFSNPNNMQFLQYDFLYLFLNFAILIFITPLSKLIGINKSIKFYYLTSIIISVIMFFIDFDSSYSIDIAKLFLSIFSSFSLCIYIIDISRRKFITDINKLKVFTGITCLFASIIPIIFYSFLNFSMSYNILYLFIAGLMLNSFIFYNYDKKR